MVTASVFNENSERCIPFLIRLSLMERRLSSGKFKERKKETRQSCQPFFPSLSNAATTGLKPAFSFYNFSTRGWSGRMAKQSARTASAPFSRFLGCVRIMHA
jgi:hypothetical protein